MKYRKMISRILCANEIVHLVFSCGKNELYDFYCKRILNVYNYGLFQGRELLKMICRCAFNDSCLTDEESIVIMETCLDPMLDNILMEVNYNAGW